jgi:hypothetical protein
MPRKAKTSKAVPKTPKAVPSTEARPGEQRSPFVLERVKSSFLNLLTWAEAQLTRISAGELDPSASLIDSIVKALTTASKELPRLEAELARLADPDLSWTATDEAQGKALLSEAGFTTPNDDDMSPEEVAEFEAVLADRHNVQIDNQPPVLTTPKY